MKKLLLLTVIYSFILHAAGQVKGVVVDSAFNKPLGNAVVSMYIEKGATDTTYTLTNDKGEFSFDKTPVSDFSLIVSYTGYRNGKKFRRIYGGEKAIDMGRIILASMAIILGEIKVHTAPISVKEDTIEYRSDGFKVKENAVVEDLLKKLPGISVDRNGNIKAQGKAVTKVKVNGKDFFGGDPKTATKELPANIVDKIQVIDDYGDQATITGIKDSDPEKVMNIQLKKDRNNGYFGRMVAGVGDHGRYQFSGNGNYFKNNSQVSVFVNSNNISQSVFGSGNRENNSGSGTSVNTEPALSSGGSIDGITTLHSFGINYRSQPGKKLTVFGSYSFTRKRSAGFKIISQQNIFSTDTYFNNQENSFEIDGSTHQLFLNIEYNIDSFNFIKFSPTLSIGKNITNSDIIFDYSTIVEKKSEGYFYTSGSAKTPNLSGTVLFSHRFRKRGRNFTMNLSAGNSINTSTRYTNNNTVLYNPASNTNLLLFNSQDNSNSSYNIRFTYTEPLSTTRFFDAALSHNLSYAGNNRTVYDIDPITNRYIFDPGLSNEYENNFFTNRANVTLRTMEKRYNYTFGVSLLPVLLKGRSVTKDSAYTPVKRVNIFPVARFAYNFSKTRSITASYRGDAQQPSFSQLQDVIDSSNLQYQTRGNPNLKPSLVHNFNVQYNNFNFTKGTVLFTSFTFNKIQNHIIYNVRPLGNSGAQMSSPVNINGYYTLNGFYNISKPYNNRRYIAGMNGTISYLNNITVVDNIKNTGMNWVIGQGFSFEFNKDWLQATATVNYNINSINYSGIAGAGKSSYSSWVVGSNMSVEVGKLFTARYDIEYTINKGLYGQVSKNPIIINLTAEKQLFKKKTGIIRLQAFDLLDRNSNIYRQITGNSIIDYRTTKLSRYVMASFTYRFQRFSSLQNRPK